MKNNREYWEDRAAQNILNSEENAAEIASRVEGLYNRAIKDIEASVNKTYARYAQGQKMTLEEVRQQLTPAELKGFNKELAAYLQYAKENKWETGYIKRLEYMGARVSLSRLEELQINIYNTLQELYQYELAEFTTGLSKQYNESFLQTMYTYQTGFEVGFSFTSPSALAINKAITTRWNGKNYSERIWKDRDLLVFILDQEIKRSFALGYNPIKTARNIRNTIEPRFAERWVKGRMGEKRRLQSHCFRLARTECNHIANEANIQSVMVLDQELGGIFEQYKYSATLDGKTSEICASLDGHQFLLSEKEIGVNFPPMHPNCRSTFIVLVDNRTISERIAKDPKGKYYYVPSDISYKEWYASLSDETKLQYKIANNRKEDLKQLNKYRDRLGRKDLPKSVAEFQKIKYYNPDEYQKIKDMYLGKK